MGKIIVLLLGMGFPWALFADTREPVDLLLVLATDVSGSISSLESSEYPEIAEAWNEYELQQRGIVAALRDPDIADLLEQCTSNGVGITYLEWSGDNLDSRRRTKQVVPWTHLRNRRDLHAFASQIESIKLRSSNGETDVANAIDVSRELIDGAPWVSGRKVISLSSDGDQNVPPKGVNPMEATRSMFIELVNAARDRAVEQGIVIDALVIMNDIASHSPESPLNQYYDENVIGGPGAFVVPISDFQDYADGLKTKLLRELNICLM